MKIKELDNEIRDISNGINVEIKTIIQWIETYLGVHFDEHIEIPELPYTISKTIKNRINFDSLKDSLQSSQKRMNSELHRCESFIQELRLECQDYISKQEALMNEVAQLKQQLLMNRDDIFTNKQETENLSKENALHKDMIKNLKMELAERTEAFTKFLQKINSTLNENLEKIKQNYLIVNNFPALFYKSSYAENLKDQINNSLQNLFEILDTFLNEYNSTLGKLEEHRILKSEMEKFRKDNILKETQVQVTNESRLNDEKFQMILRERNEMIESLNQEINLLKSLQMPQDNKLESENLERIRILEKKIANLSNEVELKELQIRNQQEMLSRRNNEIEEIRGKTSENFKPKGRSVSPDHLLVHYI